MTDDTSILLTATPPVPPAILSGQELYDMIMATIEPDLLSSNVEGLAEKYGAQTDAEREERAGRYRAAFDEYERRLEEYQQQWNAQLHTYKRQAIAYIEHESATDESSQLEEIESSFDL